MAQPQNDFPVTVPIDVLWGDMDALGHVNNARFLVWFESVRIVMFERLGIVTRPDVTSGPILATAACEYLEPVHYPARVVAGARISKVGNTSFVMEYGIWHEKEPQRLVARGSTVVVMYDYTAKSKVRVSDELRAAITALG